MHACCFHQGLHLSWFSLCRADDRLCVVSCGFADVSVGSYDMGSRMFKQRTQLQTQLTLNAKNNGDELLRLFDHNLMMQHDTSPCCKDLYPGSGS